MSHTSASPFRQGILSTPTTYILETCFSVSHPIETKTDAKGGCNLGLRYRQPESSVRNALLQEVTNSSRLSISAANKSQSLREKVEMFHGLVIDRLSPKSRKLPNLTGGSSRSVHLELGLGLKGLALRVLYVQMCCLRLPSPRGFSLDLQSITCFAPGTAGICGGRTAGISICIKSL